jgi:hypothetical protein
MTTFDERRDCPDWFCTPARCRCGADWAPICDHLEVPANVVLSDN